MEKEKADLIVLALYLGLPLAFLVIQYFIGGAIEKSHIRSLEAREAADADILLTNLETPPTVAGGCKPVLVAGEAVISSDFFKNWLFGFVSFFGGESRTFTRLFDRARREATRRMVDEARRAGCHAICNVRYSSVDVAGNSATNGSSKKTLKLASCLVTGTAY